MGKDMQPILPRVFLWTDKQAMDEFFRLDPINETLFEVFATLHEEPFVVHIDAVKVFNEVYYQTTRMIYEHPLPSDLPKYITDIKANIGWNYSAELVMSMTYFLLSLIDRKEHSLNKFFTKAIHDRFYSCLYWKPFKHRLEILRKRNRVVKFPFIPCPVSVSWLKDKYVHWNEITRNYDLMCIDKVIKLWNDMDDQREIAAMINDSISYYTTKRHSTDIEHLKNILAFYMASTERNAILNYAMNPPEEDVDELKARIEEIHNEKIVLQSRIDELEAENNRLNALLGKKKQNGTSRKFTLVQIVNYCKNCVEWKDVKSIVAMLNKLLRREATEEDSELVDSIETEFKNRKYGNIFNGAQVTMQNPQIQDVYRITGNDTVNMGEMEDGEEE